MEGLPWDVEGGGGGDGTCWVCGQGRAASEVTPAGRVPGPWSQAAACSRVRRTAEGDRGQLEERRAGSTPLTPHRGCQPRTGPQSALKRPPSRSLTENPALLQKSALKVTL
ncbi:unnamed protein product [Arctogadus glacialis]